VSPEGTEIVSDDKQSFCPWPVSGVRRAPYGGVRDRATDRVGGHLERLGRSLA
jgi:hypothetical protein